jgi:hypothetical protein
MVGPTVLPLAEQTRNQLSKLTIQVYLRPSIIDSMFQVPGPPEIGARAMPTQHKVDFQHSTFLLLYTYCRCLFKVCVEN